MRQDTSPVGAATSEPAPASAAPRRAGLWAALTYAIATLLIGYPALAGQFLVNSRSDQYIAGYAYRAFEAQWMRAGHGVPSWDPYLFGGIPYVAGMHGDIFYPPSVLLRWVLPTDVAMTWGFLLHLFVAGCATYAFLRRGLGLGFYGALLGGLAYMLGGNVAGLVSPGHDGKLYVSTFLPVVLLLVHAGVRDGRRWAWGALALAIMLAVLSPHPQLLQYLLLTAGAYGLFVALSGHRDSSPGDDGSSHALSRATAVRRLGLATVSVMVGLVGGAIQYWPLAGYTPWSPRAGGKGYEHAISFSMPPEELFNTYLPQFSGILDRYAGRNGIHYHSEYLGAAVLVLAGFALRGTALMPASTRRQRWFWAGTLVVATLWALGGYTPFYHLVYALVPGTTYFRAPSTMLYVVSFCTAVLAGIGADRAVGGPARGSTPRASAKGTSRARGVGTGYALGWTGVALLIALLATAGGLSTLALGFALPGREPLVDANAPALTLGAWRSFLAVAVVAGVLVARGRGALSARATGWALAAVVGLDLWSVERNYFQFSPPAAQLYASDPVIDYLAHLPEPGRVVPLATQELTGTTRDPYFGGGDGRGAGLMLHGIRSAVGYHGNELGRYDVLSGWDSDWPKQLGNPNFRRLANVRYLYTDGPTPPVEGMRLVAGPTRNVAGNMAYLWAFAEDNPVAWVAPVAVKAPDESVLATVLDPRFDVRRAALFDTAAAVATQPVPPALPAPSDVVVRATRYEPGHLTLALDRPAPANAALVVSENFYPGWRATADGRSVPVGRADYVLIGVGLPAGARSVDLTFQDPRYVTGATVTLAAVALALVAFGVGAALDRRVVSRSRAPELAPGQ